MNPKNTHIFLAGGGEAEDSKLLDEQFVKMLDISKPLIYIPNAMNSNSYKSGLEWLKSIMMPLGVVKIEMWDNLQPHYSPKGIAGIYIGGGDTAKLLQEIRDASFDKYLQLVAKKSIPIYGGSALAPLFLEKILELPQKLSILLLQKQWD